MRPFRLFAALIAAVAVSADSGESIRCAGILGNSGEQGESLIRFGVPGADSGLGVAFDRFGSLWSRGGAGVLNRYALDGRRLASYNIPKDPPSRDKDAIALVGDDILLRIGKKLCVLPVDAPDGSAAKLLSVEVDLMSPSSHDGWVAAAKGTEIFLVNAAGESKAVASMREAPRGLEIDGSGNVYCMTYGGLQKIVPGAPDGLAPGTSVGGRPQFLDGFWYGSNWHSTLRRFNKELQPDPGVVLGGASGSFIGHVDEQAEIVNPRGLAKINPSLLAVSGISGVIHLLEWKEADKRFEPLRRIGATSACDALCLDKEGRIWHLAGRWNWNDGPEAPLSAGISQPEKLFGLAMIDANMVSGYGCMWGKPVVIYGKMDKELRIGRIEKPTALPKSAVGVAVVQHGKRRALLVLEADGKATAVQLGPNGEYQDDIGPVQLTPSAPVKEWSSLAAPDSKTLLAAGDGFVLEFAREGDNWKETRRWNSWGDTGDAKLGGKIWLASDAGRLWISDTERHRVVCLAWPDKRLHGVFGTTDSSGDSLGSLNAPRTLAACGSRAVVFDSGNQRILKLEASGR